MIRVNGKELTITEENAFYVILDSPAVKVVGTRHVRHTNKPRRLHETFLEAELEADRLARKTGYRALVLKVVKVVEQMKEEKSGLVAQTC